MVLLRLLEGSDSSIYEHRVVTLGPKGPLAERIQGLGVETTFLGARTAIEYAVVVPRLVRALRKNKPDVVQTWMYHSDLVGGYSARLAGIDAVVWGLHATLFPPPHRSPAMKAGLALGARLSNSVPKVIVCCSQETARVHSEIGYASHKMSVIPNGFVPGSVLTKQSPRPTFTIARIGRNHPQKDLPSLLRALSLVVRTHPEVRLILIGDGMEAGDPAVAALIAKNGVSDKVELWGRCMNLSAHYPSFDLVVSSSGFGEALPMVLGEAMAAGVPVVTTDVGDSARLVGDADRVVPPHDPEALSRAICRVVALSARQLEALGKRDQERISQHYSLTGMVSAYESIYAKLASART